jgi:hypothetical protein
MHRELPAKPYNLLWKAISLLAPGMDQSSGQPAIVTLNFPVSNDL